MINVCPDFTVSGAAPDKVRSRVSGEMFSVTSAAKDRDAGESPWRTAASSNAIRNGVICEVSERHANRKDNI